MEHGGAFLQDYNCQLAVDEGHQIIVAQAVTNQCPDNANLIPLLEQVHEACGDVPRRCTADAGYWSPEVPEACDLRGTEVYICLNRRRHHAEDEPTPTQPGPQDDRALLAMRKKLQTPEGRAIYARRKAVVEPVHGQIKQARGFRQFLVCGLSAVGAQWSLVCTEHNLLKLYRATCARI